MFLHSHPMSALVSMPLSRAMWLSASKFRADPWYRGAEVDALSKQEAAMGGGPTRETTSIGARAIESRAYESRRKGSRSFPGILGQGLPSASRRRRCKI